MIDGIVKSVSARLMAAPLAPSRYRSNLPVSNSSRRQPAVPLVIRDIRRLYRVGLFHRLEGSSNLNSHDENNGTGSLPDRFG